MKTQWHQLSFPCPQCDRQTTLLTIDAAGDGEMAVNALCATCGKTLTFKTDIRLILTYCVQADVLFPMEQQLKESEDNE